MEKGEFANLTTKQLQKRKKYAYILLVIGKGFHNALFASAAACIVIFLPIYMGKKKIEGELKNRENN